jgi:hypothetical protein
MITASLRSKELELLGMELSDETAALLWAKDIARRRKLTNVKLTVWLPGELKYGGCKPIRKNHLIVSIDNKRPAKTAGPALPTDRNQPLTSYR